jgi:hypothetical protein
VNELEVYWRENPDAPDRQLMASSHGSAWLVPADEPVGLQGMYEFDEVDITAGASLNIAGVGASIMAHRLIGDNTGVANIRVNQTFFANSTLQTDFNTTIAHKNIPMSLYTHRGSTFHAPHSLALRSVNATFHGWISRVYNITVGKDSYLNIERFVNDSFELDQFVIKNGGQAILTASPSNTVSVRGRKMHMHAGSRVDANDLFLNFTLINIDSYAVLALDGTTPGTTTGTYHGAYGGRGEGVPSACNAYGACGNGDSGAGFGGTGGTGIGARARVGTAYGAFRMPVLLGSRGGASVFPYVGGAGGGRLRMEVATNLTLDGTITAKGGAGPSPRSGGGSGGSVWIQTDVFDGDGLLDVTGGSGEGSSVALSTASVAAEAEGKDITLTCATYGMTIIKAQYGSSCGVAEWGTDDLRKACNGRTSCLYRIDSLVIGDPAPGCSKDYVVTYQCTSGRQGGGGGGGRAALYSRDNIFTGMYLASGGNSAHEAGGAGTVYSERVAGNHAGFTHSLTAQYRRRRTRRAHTRTRRSCRASRGFSPSLARRRWTWRSCTFTGRATWRSTATYPVRASTCTRVTFSPTKRRCCTLVTTRPCRPTRRMSTTTSTCTAVRRCRTRANWRLRASR